MKELDDFYKVISTFLSDQSLQWKLLQQPTYENFIDLLRKLVAL